MTPEEVLTHAYRQAESSLDTPFIADPVMRARVEYVCRCGSNRAGVRLLLACMLGKIDNPAVDPRKPYTEIGSEDCFSGRTYDERYLTEFIAVHRLPANTTTAFLTPTLRNISAPLTTDQELIGKPRDLYRKSLELLEDVAEERLDAYILLVETIRLLIQRREQDRARTRALLDALRQNTGTLPLSVEAIVTLIGQHLACRNASRLPVLVVAAAYQAAGERLREQVLPLRAHNAADSQTGALGDVEICLIDEDDVVTAYEMKLRRVTRNDIDTALLKISQAPTKIDNYLFVTTEPIDPLIAEYATSLYEQSGGVEIAILDCLSFLRHFLHLFSRIRIVYLEAYQTLVLNEPDSAVSQVLKQAFLALRQTAEMPG